MGENTDKIGQALNEFLQKARERGFSDSLTQSGAAGAPPNEEELAKIIQLWNGESVSQFSETQNIHEEEIAWLASLPPKVGNFKIEKLIGRGGFGTVFLAIDETTGKKVALKFLHSSKEKHREIFFREAFLISQLQHPFIVSSSFFGEHEGRAYYAMELVEGSSLAKVIEVLRREISTYPEKSMSFYREPVEDLVPIPYNHWILQTARNIAQALVHIHQQGVVHKDLKPGNILLDARAQAKLGDFGIATQQQEGSVSQPLGTIPFMSPEQLRGEELGPASDIFSFGSTFYEAMTLQRPFPGKDKAEIRRAILEIEPVAPRSHNPDIPQPVEAILMKCLQKRAELRYRTAAALEADLLAAMNHQPALTATSPAPMKTRKGFIWVAALACAVTLAVGYAILKDDHTPSETQPITDTTPVETKESKMPDPAPINPQEAGVPVIPAPERSEVPSKIEIGPTTKPNPEPTQENSIPKKPPTTNPAPRDSIQDQTALLVQTSKGKLLLLAVKTPWKELGLRNYSREMQQAMRLKDDYNGLEDVLWQGRWDHFFVVKPDGSIARANPQSDQQLCLDYRAAIGGGQVLGPVLWRRPAGNNAEHWTSVFDYQLKTRSESGSPRHELVAAVDPRTRLPLGNAGELLIPLESNTRPSDLKSISESPIAPSVKKLGTVIESDWGLILLANKESTKELLRNFPHLKIESLSSLSVAKVSGDRVYGFWLDPNANPDPLNSVQVAAFARVADQRIVLGELRGNLPLSFERPITTDSTYIIESRDPGRSNAKTPLPNFLKNYSR